MRVFVLIVNSRSEMAEVVGAFASQEAAMVCAEGIESTYPKPRRPLVWQHVIDEDEEAERWVAEFGVVDQYEVHALGVRS